MNIFYVEAQSMCKEHTLSNETNELRLIDWTQAISCYLRKTCMDNFKTLMSLHCHITMSGILSIKIGFKKPA